MSTSPIEGVNNPYNHPNSPNHHNTPIIRDSDNDSELESSSLSSDSSISDLVLISDLSSSSELSDSNVSDLVPRKKLDSSSDPRSEEMQEILSDLEKLAKEVSKITQNFNKTSPNSLIPDNDISPKIRNHIFIKNPKDDIDEELEYETRDKSTYDVRIESPKNPYDKTHPLESDFDFKADDEEDSNILSQGSHPLPDFFTPYKGNVVANVFDPPFLPILELHEQERLTIPTIAHKPIREFSYDYDERTHFLTQQKFQRSCGRTCMLMMALDLGLLQKPLNQQKAFLNIYTDNASLTEMDIISQGFEILGIHHQIGKFTTSDDIAQTEDAQKINSAQEYIEIIAKLLNKTQNSVIIDITHPKVGGHFIIVDSITEERVYIRDPYLGECYILTREKMATYLFQEGDLHEIIIFPNIPANE